MLPPMRGFGRVSQPLRTRFHLPFHLSLPFRGKGFTKLEFLFLSNTFSEVAQGLAWVWG